VNETFTSTSGSTGNVLWDGSIYLLRYLLSLPSSELSRIKGRDVLELGSGTGFLAAHLARNFECEVTATGLPYCKELVEGTIKANDLTSNCR
jgi:predicted nicotinamide N-methyase